MILLVKYLPLALLWLLVLSPDYASAFLLQTSPANSIGGKPSPSPSLHNIRSALSSTSNSELADLSWKQWAADHRIEAPKLNIRDPTADERGKGGVIASEKIAALDVLLRVPAHLVLSTSNASSQAIKAASRAKENSWATQLTAAALTSDLSWVGSWSSGGWATDSKDLGECAWGSDGVTGTLMATGSDNDKEVFAKFRFPCHPVVHRAAVGLAALTGHDEAEAQKALTERGRAFRAMRDALIPLVVAPTDRGKGSMRDRRCWDVADALSRILSRAAEVEIDGALSHCVVPLHERLDHASLPNTKLVCFGGREVCLVATREIEEGEGITRNYFDAPRLIGDESEGALRLLLQFGLPPNAWTK